MRVVSLLAAGTEIICALGAGESLVGRSHECDNPPWVAALPACTRPAFDIAMPSGQIDAEVRRSLRAGEPLYHVDRDLIDSLRPDVLVAQEHCEVCAVTPRDVGRVGCVARRRLESPRADGFAGDHGSHGLLGDVTYELAFFGVHAATSPSSIGRASDDCRSPFLRFRPRRSVGR